MPRSRSSRIQIHFSTLTDPRRREGTYPLINVVTIALCAVIAGADEFVASRHETRERGHGRDEHRSYFVCTAAGNLPDRGRWAKLKAIGIAIGETVRGGKEAAKCGATS